MCLSIALTNWIIKVVTASYLTYFYCSKLSGCQLLFVASLSSFGLLTSAQMLDECWGNSSTSFFSDNYNMKPPLRCAPYMFLLQPSTASETGIPGGLVGTWGFIQTQHTSLLHLFQMMLWCVTRWLSEKEDGSKVCCCLIHYSRSGWCCLADCSYFWDTCKNWVKGTCFWRELTVNLLFKLNIFEHSPLLCGYILDVDKVLNAALNLLDVDLGHVN